MVNESLEMDEIRRRVKKEFNTPSRLGLSNGVSRKTLFQNIMDKNPESLSHFEQKFHWDRIKKAITMVNHEIHIVKMAGKIFVCRTEEESRHYRSFLDKTIDNCKVADKRSQEWVREERWRKLGKL